MRAISTGSRMATRITIFRAGPGPRLVMAWSSLPMVLAVTGAWLDEQARLGFSTWQSACRSAGLSPRSVLIFTLELLPTAVIGALLGGLIVQLCGALARDNEFMSSIVAHIRDTV